MGIGGEAEVVVIDHREDLYEVLAEPHRWLGKGANLLIADTPAPIPVVRLGPAFDSLAFEAAGERVRVQVGGAHDLARLIGKCVREGLAGPEGLAGVPASVGGALYMNAGTATTWLFDHVARVEVLLPGSREPQWLERAEVPAAYRTSGLPKGTLFLACELELERGHPDELRATASRLKQAKAASQPLSAPSAGCIFKNPRPDLPAGKLVDELGFKGSSVGGAMVSPVHANFIVNEGGALAADVLGLVARIRRAAQEQRGVTLEMEVQTWDLDDILEPVS
jgi:UDP-N-acetylmuramate dehydrogenase